MGSSGWLKVLGRLWRQACLAGLTTLVACGGGGGGGSTLETAALAGDYFPLAVGDTWVYDDSKGGRSTVRVTGTGTAEGREGLRVVVEDTSGEVSESVYLVTASGVRQVPVSGGDLLLRAIGSMEVLRLPLRVGERFVQIDRTIDSGIDFDGDGRNDQMDVRSVSEVVGVERITTAVGTFEQAAHVRTSVHATVHLSAQGNSADIDATMNDWYASGVGPVRSAMVITAAGYSETTTMDLTAWRVGARRSETTPPAVVSMSPDAGTTQRSTASVQVTFDEAIDAASAANGLTLRDAQGNTVPGTVQVGPSSLIFWPGISLGSGNYTATIAPAVADALGNAVGTAREWRFTIDITGPQIVAITPAVGATGVAPDGVITVRYDEPLANGSLTSSDVDLRSVLGDSVPVAVTITGDTVTITPQSSLARATEYMLTIGTYGYGPRDSQGNFGASGLVGRFTTDSGRFDVQQMLISSPFVEAVASGDVDGDGRKDVVVALGYDSDPEHANHLGVFHQQPGGGLGPAQWIALPSATGCRPTSVAVGDVNGDGRQDVVVAEYGCGVEVFLQDGAGVLQPATFLPSAQSYQVRVADFDGDGRQDLLALGWSDTTARLWRQSGTGTLVEAALPAIITQGWGQVAIGDLDGDGRPDFAVTSGQGDHAHALGVVLQRSDGSFMPPQYVPGSRAGALFPGVAIGDIDGDGRAELVAAIDEQRIGVWRVDSGVLVKLRDIVVADGAAQMAVADINGDGRKDLIVLRTMGTSPGLQIHLQQADGSLGAGLRYAAYASYSTGELLVVDDVSGDGRLDVLLGGSVLLQRAVLPFAEGATVRNAHGLWRRAFGRLTR